MDNETVKREIEQFNTKLSEMNAKFDRVYYALVGNDLAQDGGIIGRVVVLEKEIEIANEQIEKLKADAAKNAQQVKILWSVGGAAVMLIAKALMDYLFKH